MFIPDEIKEEIKTRINIVVVISRNVTLKQQGRNFVGSCPFHTEKTGSFTVSPEKQIYHCFGCGEGGDVYKFLTKFTGRPFPQVVSELAVEAGITIPDAPEGYTPPRPRLTIPVQKKNDTLKPREISSPEEVWQKQALLLVLRCHKALLANNEQLAWLELRGISISAVKRFKLGWLGKEDYQAYHEWGFKPEKNKKQNWRKIWLPKGITIPWFIDNEIHRIRIRRDLVPDGDKFGRYIIVKGSGNATMIIPRADNRTDTAMIAIEAELDAIAVADIAGDLITVIGNGNTTAKPDINALKILKNSPHILCAFDFDTAGEKTSDEWQDNLREAISWPVPEAKDPGEYVKDHGGDIRAWILAGLPPGLRISRKVQEQDSGSVKQKEAETSKEGKPLYISIDTKCGRLVHITGDRETYRKMEEEGKIVFSKKEVERSTAFQKDGGDPSLLIDIKEIFGGGRIKERIEL